MLARLKAGIVGGLAWLFPQTSKRSLKRKAKQEAFEATKHERRAERRKRRKLSGPKPRKLLKAEDQTPSGVKVIFDSQFGSLMTEKELSSYCRQLNHAYGFNRRVPRPVEFICANVSSELKKGLEKHSLGSESWRNVVFSNESYKSFAAPENTVYLTADSPNILETIEEGKTYVIGGLVDHNRHKSLCLNTAIADGINHACLPIGEHMKLVSRRVLTVNQCMEILLRYIQPEDMASRCWKSAFEAAIPQRKIE